MQNIIYIYIQCLFKNNVLDLYTCLMQLKLALEIKYNICKSTNKEKYILKYKFVHDNIQRIFNNIYVIDFKDNVGFLHGHSVIMTG